MRRRIFGDDANQPDKKLPKRLGFDDLEQAKPKGLTLPERLLRDWAKGDLSSKQIQDYCEGGVVPSKAWPKHMGQGHGRFP